MKKKKLTKWRKTALLAAFGLLAVSAGLFFLQKKSGYQPLFLLMLIVLLPVPVLLALTLPVLRRSTEELPEKPSEPDAEPRPDQEQPVPARQKKSAREYWHSLKRQFLRLYRKYRPAVVGILIVASVAAVNIPFWLTVRKPVSAYQLTYLTPTLMAVLAALLLVLEKFCKHIGDRNEASETPEQEAKKTYDRALVSGLRSVLTLMMAAALTVLLASVLTLAQIYDFTVILRIILAVFFAYESLFYLISLFVRLVRHEMDTAPELDIPFLGLGKDNLNVISYLEKNTGITMRSLWSIKLIKQILPISAVSIAAVLWLLSGLVKIEPYQQGAHFRLGKLQEEFLRPGLHLTLPWPIDEVKVFDTENIHKLTIGYVDEAGGDNLWTCSHGGEEYKLLLGGGKELVSINLLVEYKIDDLKAYMSCSASPERILEAAAYEVVTDHTICTDLETLLASDRTALAAAFREDITKRAGKYNTGLKIVSVVLESIHPPVEVAQVYQDMIGAEILAEKEILLAEDQAAVRVTTAKANYDISVNMEKRARYRAVADAKSQVASFMASVEADRSYGSGYRYYKYLKAITDAYAQGKIILVGEGIDADSIYIGNFAVPEKE